MNGTAALPSAAVLISGGGTNLQSFIDAIADQRLKLRLSVVVSNNPDAGGLDRAKRARIAVECLSNSDFADRRDYDRALAEKIQRYQPDFIILAGFMRILTATFVEQFSGRIINIHPSLLPQFPGLDTHARAIEAGEKCHGCTVHFVTPELDGGPGIIQGSVPIRDTDTPEVLASRVLAVEHQIYPRAAELLISGRIELRDGACWLDGRQMDEPLQFNAGSEH